MWPKYLKVVVKIWKVYDFFGFLTDFEFFIVSVVAHQEVVQAPIGKVVD